MKTEGNMKNEAPKKTNRIAGIILIILLIAGAWFGIYWYMNYIKYVYTDDAAIDSYHVSVSSNMTGRITKLTVDEGAKVTAGQLLVQIDDANLRAQENQARTALNSARQNLLLAQVNYNKTQTDFRRTKILYEQGNTSKADYDHALSELDTVNVQAAMAQSQIDNAQAQLGVILAQLQNTNIMAPVAGVIAKRSVAMGEVVQPGQSIFTLTDTKNIWVTANFEETKIRKIHQGVAAEITVDAYPNRVFQGHVVQVGADIIPPPLSIGDSTKTTQKIPVKIYFDQSSDAKLMTLGMSVEVKILAK